MSEDIYEVQSVSLKRLREEIAEKDAQIKALVEALSFYADRENWRFNESDNWRSKIKQHDSGDDGFSIASTGGHRARSALASIGKGG